jgi:hypothetical protein
MKYYILFLLFLAGCASGELKSYSCTLSWHDGILGDQKSFWSLNAYSSRSAESTLQNLFPNAKDIDCE